MIDAWLEPSPWGRELVVRYPAEDGEAPPTLAVVVFDPQGRALQSASARRPAVRDGARWVSRCLVNGIAPDEPVGSVLADRLDRRTDRVVFSVAVGDAPADLPAPIAVGGGSSLRRVTLQPGSSPGELAAVLVFELAGSDPGTVDVEVSIEGGRSRPGTTSAAGPGPAIVVVDDLPGPAGDGPVTLRVTVDTAAPPRARSLGRIPIGAAPAHPGGAPALAGVGAAVLAGDQLELRVPVPAPGVYSVGLCVRVDGEVVLTDHDPGVRLAEPLLHWLPWIPRPLPPGEATVELALRPFEVWETHAIVEVPTTPGALADAVARDVGPLRCEGAWVYCEDRPDIGRFTGLRVILRNPTDRHVTVAPRWGPHDPGDSRPGRLHAAGGVLPPGGADLFDLSDEGGPVTTWRADFEARAPREEVLRVVLAATRVDPAETA